MFDSVKVFDFRTSDFVRLAKFLGVSDYVRLRNPIEVSLITERLIDYVGQDYYTRGHIET